MSNLFNAFEDKDDKTKGNKEEAGTGDNDKQVKREKISTKE